MPLLLIHGKADLLVDPQAVVDLAVTPFFTNAEVHHLDGVGHATFYEAESIVADLILKFVSRISSDQTALPPRSGHPATG